MQCEEVANLLHAFVDGELELERTLEVERHVQECPACAQALAEQQALRTALHDPALYHRPPAGLRERIRSSLRPAARPSVAGRVLPWRRLRVGVAVAASLAFVALLAWGVVRVLSVPGADDLLAREVVAGHVRSLMASHLLDVASSDRHTVKPWFSGQLDFAPQVKDLAADGFPLSGGRLDYLDNHKAAAVVYRRNRHVINLFIWPAAGRPPSPPRAQTLQGFHLVDWTDADLTYWAVSDLNEEELREFVRLIRR
jgi:anti-sigma factor RsiW